MKNKEVGEKMEGLQTEMDGGTVGGGLKDRQGDGVREWVSPHFTVSLSCFQLIISAKGIKDEMNNMILGVRGWTGGCVCVCLCVFVVLVCVYLCFSSLFL